ncbi:cysteine rich repeat-containing protein [Aquabacterium sp.]|uniref:cysteine rich repeat-containing protein n=1 Tax=Aquabacterium sp. TaxID=1872578 RepID=UPI0037848556
MLTKISAPLLLALAAAALAPSTFAAERGRVTEACKADIKKLCPGVKPGGGRIAECLKDKKDQMSDECKADLAKNAAAKKGGSS